MKTWKQRGYSLSSCLLFHAGIWTRETCPQCASVPVQWNERDAKTKWRAAKREYLRGIVKVCHWECGTWCRNGLKKTEIKKTGTFHSVCHLKRLHVAFHSILFSHTVYTHAFSLFAFSLKLYFLFLLFRRSVSCVWNRRVLLEKYLTCRRRWSGRIKKLGYGLWASSFVFN